MFLMLNINLCLFYYIIIFYFIMSINRNNFQFSYWFNYIVSLLHNYLANISFYFNSISFFFNSINQFVQNYGCLLLSTHYSFDMMVNVLPTLADITPIVTQNNVTSLELLWFILLVIFFSFCLSVLFAWSAVHYTHKFYNLWIKLICGLVPTITVACLAFFVLAACINWVLCFNNFLSNVNCFTLFCKLNSLVFSWSGFNASIMWCASVYFNHECFMVLSPLWLLWNYFIPFFYVFFPLLLIIYAIFFFEPQHIGAIEIFRRIVIATFIIKVNSSLNEFYTNILNNSWYQ